MLTYKAHYIGNLLFPTEYNNLYKAIIIDKKVAPKVAPNIKWIIYGSFRELHRC